MAAPRHKPLARRAGDSAVYLVLRLLIATLQACSLSACERFSEVMAWIAGDVLRFRRRVLDENLQTALPHATDSQRRAYARAMWRHLFLMVAEIAHTPRKVHRTNWRQRCDMPEIDAMVRVLMLDRPKVIISGHYGNFELGGYLLGMFGFPTHTVARAIDNPLVDRYVNDFRGRTGQFMLPKHGSRDAIERVLGAGGILTLLGDQAAGDKACWVGFFGRPASTHKAVALFTLTYEAPTMVLAVRRSGGPLRYQSVLAGLADPRAPGFDSRTPGELTQWFTDRLERLIRQAPEQYWWVHRRWKGTPPERVRRRWRAGLPGGDPAQRAA